MNTLTNNLPGRSSNFPGPWLGSISLIISPLLLFLGDLLRINFHFYFPDQLEAYADHPALIMSSYNLFIIGFILMWPAILSLTQLIGVKRPTWAKFGGSLAMIGILIWLFMKV